MTSVVLEYYAGESKMRLANTERIPFRPMVERFSPNASLRDEQKRSRRTREVLPPVRIRDNTDLQPDQVRVRFYTEYLLDKQFTSAGEAVNEIIAALRGFRAD